METGLGTGLRALIQRRHENDRGLPERPVLSIVEAPQDTPEAWSQAVDAAPQQDAGDALLLTQLEEQWAKLAAAESLLVESERAIAALTHERDRRREQSARLVRRVRERERQLEQRHDELVHLGRVTKDQLDEIERLGGDVRGCDAEIERLRDENGRLRAQAGRFATKLRNGSEQSDRQEAGAPPATSHLVFAQLGDGYELVESDGPPPALNTLLGLPQLCEDEFVVTRLGRSPLPADTRSCVFVQRV